MKKIPNKLKIGGHTVKVKIVPMNHASGQWDTKDNTIMINKDESKSQQEATLIHEIFHALNAQWDMNPTMHAWMESLSQQWYQVLSDNHMLK